MALNNYSNTKCPKCEATRFELAEDIPSKSNFKLFYLRCSSCKTFLASLDYYSNSLIIEDLEKVKKALKIP